MYSMPIITKTRSGIRFCADLQALPDAAAAVRTLYTPLDFADWPDLPDWFHAAVSIPVVLPNLVYVNQLFNVIDTIGEQHQAIADLALEHMAQTPQCPVVLRIFAAMPHLRFLALWGGTLSEGAETGAPPDALPLLETLHLHYCGEALIRAFGLMRYTQGFQGYIRAANDELLVSGYLPFANLAPMLALLRLTSSVSTEGSYWC